MMDRKKESIAETSSDMTSIEEQSYHQNGFYSPHVRLPSSPSEKWLNQLWLSHFLW